MKVLSCLRREGVDLCPVQCSEQCVTPICIPIPQLGAPLRTTRHTRQGRGVFTGQSPWPLLFFALLCFSLLYTLISGTATSKSVKLKVENAAFCEAQGKGRAKGRPSKVTQRSFIDYRLSIIDILSLELTLNLAATFPPPPPTFQTVHFYIVSGL